MQYRRLGRSGLQVSQLSVGSWVTYANQVNVKAAKEMLALAMDSGVNFFDNAEVYAGGKSEEVMGDALKALKWPRNHWKSCNAHQIRCSLYCRIFRLNGHLIMKEQIPGRSMISSDILFTENERIGWQEWK